MKKRLLMILTLAILLVGCGDKEETDNTIAGNQTTTETPSTDEATTNQSSTPETPTEPPHEHTYTESTTKEATCTEAGEKTFTCDCGDTYTEAIETTGHNYEAVADSEISASCTNDGKEADTKCSLCDDVISGVVIPATGHNYETVANSSAEPTCTADGKKEDTKCSLCGDVINGEAISATGHSYGNYVYNNDATVGKDGTETAKCSTCGKTKTRTKEGTALTPNYVGYDEFGNGYTLDEKGDKVFYVSNPYPINQAVWISDKEVYYYGIWGQPQISAPLGREMAKKHGLPWDERFKSETIRLGYYDGQLILYIRVYMVE